MFGIFAALAKFERALISEGTKVGLTLARARGRNGGGQYKMTPAKLRLAMGQKETVGSELCKELGVTRQTLYRPLALTVGCVKTGKRCWDAEETGAEYAKVSMLEIQPLGDCITD